MAYALVVACIEQVYLLLHVCGASIGWNGPFLIFDIDAGQDVARIVEASCLGLGNANEALLLLILPHSARSILAARNEGAVQRIEIKVSDLLRVTDKGTQNVVVMQGPVHDADYSTGEFCSSLQLLSRLLAHRIVLLWCVNLTRSTPYRLL